MFSHDSVRFRHLVLRHCSIVTHINPKGGRFNDGLFGAFYLASREQTAALEVKHHQQRYWANVEGPVVTHSAAPIHKVTCQRNRILGSPQLCGFSTVSQRTEKEASSRSGIPFRSSRWHLLSTVHSKAYRRHRPELFIGNDLGRRENRRS
ncbi:RES family NAD+ phosphorylase [Vibrio vulnificus]|uniref:RES family NAD+ phosphorylase n=1 Tax=Vibrio vulnificus TaxID=672 RepID=UPI002FBDA429